MGKIYDREYYLRNREEHLAKSKSYYEANKEKIREYGKVYYARVREERKAQWNEKSKARYLVNRDKSLAWQKENHKVRRIETLELVGGCFCKVCGFTDWRALQIDHVNGGGNKERKEHGGQLTRKKQSELITRNPNGYQVLCANCNFIKRYEKGETAKKRKNIEPAKEGLG